MDWKCKKSNRSSYLRPSLWLLKQSNAVIFRRNAYYFRYNLLCEYCSDSFGVTQYHLRYKILIFLLFIYDFENYCLCEAFFWLFSWVNCIPNVQFDTESQNHCFSFQIYTVYEIKHWILQKFVVHFLISWYIRNWNEILIPKKQLFLVWNWKISFL
jgi:hypothetical protein